MNLFALSGLLSGIACLIMGGLVYFPNRRTRTNRLWAIFCLTVSVWGFGALLIGLTPDAQVALGLWRLAHVGVILIPVLFYHFVTAFTSVRRPKTLAALYVVAAGFLLLDATPWFIREVRWMFGEVYYDSSPGLAYMGFVGFFVGVLALSHVELWRHLRGAKQSTQRILTRWLLGAALIGFGGGATCFLPVFGLELYPYGNFAVPLFPLIMTYAFLRYRLMDVNLAVIRGLTFLLLYALVIGVPFAVGYYYQPLWERLFGGWWWTVPVVVMGLLSAASPVLFLVVVRRMEQRLMKTQRRYHRTLMAASSGMIRIKDLRQLCRLIVYFVSRAVHLTNSGLFLYDPQNDRYELVAVRYRHLLPAGMVIKSTDPLVQVIQQERDLLVLEELEATHAGRVQGEWSKKRADAYAWMRQLEARLVVPSFSSERLLAFLVLGGKRNGEMFTADDIGVFSALANQAALGIENALVFEELKTNEAYMIQSEKLASLGQLASGMAHEIHNPLTIISGEAQLHLERFKGKDEEVDRVLRSIIEESHRAADITRRILRFAKPAASDFLAVDLRVVVDESLALTGYHVRLDTIDRKVSLPPDLPKVRGNQNQLQEVCLNLILNACQAMGSQGGRLEVAGGVKGDQVEFTIQDTGPGIPQSKLKKVFDPFYTTKGNGTGLGLFVSQRIIRAHGGAMAVTSTEGEGTTFTIRLPIFQEHNARGSSQSQPVVTTEEPKS